MKRGLARSRGVQSIAATVVLTAAILLWIHAEGGPSALQAHYGWLAPALWIPAQIVVNLSPASDLVPWAVLNGSMYGVWSGALISWAVWLCAASLQFAIARRTALDFDLDERGSALPAWLRRLPVGHPIFLIAGRWIPVSSALVNVAAGALGVPYRRLLWCAALGCAPPAIALAAVGAGLIHAF
jgi:uncharacterized membrane protein YdjX (TVP38/TMEM64 family)